MSFSENLKRLRTDKGLTQEQLGALCGFAESNISIFETGNREPGVTNLSKLKNGLNCTFDELLVDTTDTIRVD